MSLADAFELDGAQDARQLVARMGGLVSQADLGRRWGLTRQRVHQMSREPGFPAPVDLVNGRAVWFAASVDQWREHRELCLAKAALD